MLALLQVDGKPVVEIEGAEAEVKQYVFRVLPGPQWSVELEQEGGPPYRVVRRPWGWECGCKAWTFNRDRWVSGCKHTTCARELKELLAALMPSREENGKPTGANT